MQFENVSAGPIRPKGIVSGIDHDMCQVPGIELAELNEDTAAVFAVRGMSGTRRISNISANPIVGMLIGKYAIEDQKLLDGVITMDIDTASAKVSSGMPDDEDDDYDIPIWAGVLPITSTIGRLQNDDRLLPDVVPSAAMRALQDRTL